MKLRSARETLHRDAMYARKALTIFGLFANISNDFQEFVHEFTIYKIYVIPQLFICAKWIMIPRKCHWKINKDDSFRFEQTIFYPVHKPMCFYVLLRKLGAAVGLESFHFKFTLISHIDWIQTKMIARKFFKCCIGIIIK